MFVEFNVRTKKKMDIFTGGSVITDYELIFCPEATMSSLKCLNDGFVHYKVFFPVFSRDMN